jgi:hypothetical protein
MDKQPEIETRAIEPEEKKAIQALRKALSRIDGLNLPKLKDLEYIPDLINELESGRANLVYEIKSSAVRATRGPKKGEVVCYGLKLTCSVENAESGARGFLFEFEETFGQAGLGLHLIVRYDPRPVIM